MPRKTIPILMYHSIDSISKGQGLRSLHVSKWLFRIQMSLLKLLRYRGMSMTELYPYLTGKKEGRVVGITFDDGYENNLLNALPILKKNGFTATCYIVSQNINGFNYWDAEKDFKSFKMMDYSQIRKWIDSGMEIGSHSSNHIKLSKLSASELRKEIHNSKNTLEELFTCKIDHFCYPYGDTNKAITTEVKKNGYLTGVSVNRGLVKQKNEMFSLPRVFVTHRTYPHLFLLKILTSYENKRGI